MRVGNFLTTCFAHLPKFSSVRGLRPGPEGRLSRLIPEPESCMLVPAGYSRVNIVSLKLLKLLPLMRVYFLIFSGFSGKVVGTIQEKLGLAKNLLRKFYQSPAGAPELKLPDDREA